MHIATTIVTQGQQKTIAMDLDNKNQNQKCEAWLGILRSGLFYCQSNPRRGALGTIIKKCNNCLIIKNISYINF